MEMTHYITEIHFQIMQLFVFDSHVIQRMTVHGCLMAILCVGYSNVVPLDVKQLSKYCLKYLYFSEGVTTLIDWFTHEIV